MKLIFLILVLVAAIYGCREGKATDKVREFIPGAYIRYSKHEFGEEYDTVAITIQSTNTYRLVRRWKYERVHEAPNYQLIITTGVWHKSDRLMEDTDSGDFLSFDIDSSCLFIGTTKYEKL